jgi:hypothetical protein
MTAGRIGFLLTPLLLASCAAIDGPPPAPGPTPGGWEPIWADEFDGAGIDQGSWTPEVVPDSQGHGFFIILNLDVGGWFDKPHSPPDDLSPLRLYVDWVRVYRPAADG